MDRRRDIAEQPEGGEPPLSPVGRRILCDLPENIGVMAGEVDLVDTFLGVLLADLLAGNLGGS